jgi:Cd2+/Zn2+-exporting ATPase
MNDAESSRSQQTAKQTRRTATGLILSLMGGVLVFNSYIVALYYQWVLKTDGRFAVDVTAAIGAILLALPIIYNAVRGLVEGKSRMDELVALAVVAALALQEYQIAGVVAFFMLVSQLIETRTALGARAAIEGLIRLTPTKARLIVGGQEEEVDVADLRAGQLVRCRPGDNIPADGMIRSGESTVNEANITGESLPVDKVPGDQVFSGTSNLTGAVEVEVTKAGADTTLGRVQHLILQAEKTRIPLMRIIDQYVVWYTPIVLMLAGIVLFFTRDMSRAVTVIVVACPGALILATPTAVVAALSCAARLGIMVKNVANLETAARLTSIVFDKTGTLTTGQLAVTRLQPAGDVEGGDLILFAATAEQDSNHPAARAMVNVARQANLDLERPTSFEEVPGRGVIATVNGSQILVGRQRFLEERGVSMAALSEPELKEAEGFSTLYIAKDGQCIGWAGLEDRTRPEARQAVEDLRELGLKRLTMVTGDRTAVARRVARDLGCGEVLAEVLPQDKLELVDSLKREGHLVAVVGDGVNDAPALAAGHLGVAMGAAGSDVAMNSASVALMNNDLARIPFLIKLSRKTRAVIAQNLIFGVFFIVTVVTLAMLNIVGAILGVLLHTLSSLVVIFNSARLVRYGEEFTPFEAPEETSAEVVATPA